MHEDRIFLGVNGTVLALRVKDGAEVWRTRLGGFFGGGYVTGVTYVGDRLYATCQGEITCLDPATGHIHWHNGLSGLGTGFVAVAGSDSAGAAEIQHATSASAASAAATVAVIAASSAASSS